MEEIIAVDKNLSGEIISFKTSSGRVISYRKALNEIENGTLSGVQISEEQSNGLPVIVLESTLNNESLDHFPPIY